MTIDEFNFQKCICFRVNEEKDVNRNKIISEKDFTYYEGHGYLLTFKGGVAITCCRVLESPVAAIIKQKTGDRTFKMLDDGCLMVNVR